MVFNIFSVVFVDEKAPLPLERANKRVWPDPVARKHGISGITGITGISVFSVSTIFRNKHFTP